MGLTALQVKTAKPGDGIAKLYGDGNGLFLRVAPSGSKSWIYRYQFAGKRRDMGMGAVVTMPLADAREEVITLAKMIRQGVDPIEQRKATKAAPAALQIVTFAQACTDYIAARGDGWKNPKHKAQWTNTLATYAKFGAKPINTVTIDDVEQSLRPIWLEKSETATRVLSRIICVIAFAADKGWCPDDGATWSGRLRRRLPMMPSKSERVQHHPALPFDQMGKFMADLRSRTSTGGKALEFGILCASRSSEVRLATWSEVDLDAQLWIVPASRMKMKREHRIPLSAQAVALLRSLPEGKPTDYIFPGEKAGKPLSDMTLTAALRRRNEEQLIWKDEQGAAIVPHGFRSTFSDWASETTPFPSTVVEMALAHTIGNKVEAAYRRGDLFEKRRELMQAWANYCGSL